MGLGPAQTLGTQQRPLGLRRVPSSPLAVRVAGPSRDAMDPTAKLQQPSLWMLGWSGERKLFPLSRRDSSENWADSEWPICSG